MSKQFNSIWARVLPIFTLVLQLMFVQSIRAEDSDDYVSVKVAESFIEFHTGPGRGYPVFHIAEKGELIQVIKSRTQWYKVKTNRDVLGWVHESQLIKTLNLSGDLFAVKHADQSDYVKRGLGAGILGGDFGGARIMTLHGNWNWTENIEMQIDYSQALGNSSDIQFVNVGLLHQVFPEWRVSPFVRISGGVIKTSPHSTLILTEDREDEMVGAGIGVRAYISGQFFLRAEYNSYTILTSRDDNDDIEEWKIGFSVFF